MALCLLLRLFVFRLLRIKRFSFFLSSRRRHTRCSRDLEFRRVLFRSRFWRLFRPYRLRILPLLPHRNCRRPAIPQPDNAGAFRLDSPFLDSGTASLSDGWELMNMGMLNLAATFWICLVLVAYNYVGYPLVIFLLSVLSQAKSDLLFLFHRGGRRCTPPAQYFPKVAVLMSVHNEEAVIQAKRSEERRVGKRV